MESIGQRFERFHIFVVMHRKSLCLIRCLSVVHFLLYDLALLIRKITHAYLSVNGLRFYDIGPA